MTKYLITGPFGFIGSYLIKYILTYEPTAQITAVGRDTNQKNFARLEKFKSNPNLQIIYKDFAKDDLSEIFDDVQIAFHLGAKTFVDHSIRDPKPFIESNIIGTYNMLEAARKCRTLEKYFQFSTDEVYGPIEFGAHLETAQLSPSNPYSSTKAAGDMLATSYFTTYKVPVIITRTENNYGPFQGKEKVIPTFVRKALAKEPLPVYGDGKHRRQWLHVRDTCRALLHLSKVGEAGQIYNIAGSQEMDNLELATLVLKIMGYPPNDMIEFIPDYNIRPGHDRRYAINNAKLISTGWNTTYTIESGFNEVVDWYSKNQWWLK